MNKQKIIVPEGIRFLSDWDWFKLSEFPSKCIINKQIPGCGFTEYCIRSSENIILCSPRKLLLENKWDQHKGEVYLVRNEMDKDPGVDKDLNKIQKTIKKEANSVNDENMLSNKRVEIYQKLYSEIEEYKIKCFLQNRPMKVLVTYDSYHIVVDILGRLNVFQYFFTVIDEFQSILHDSRFKSDTELGFLNCLKCSHSALFVSATPMMDEYLEMLDEFKDLPYYELDWYTSDQTRVIKPDLDVYLMTSVGSKAEEIIKKYLNEEFERVVVVRDNQPIEVISDEAVLYVNSVNHIISIIKKCGLTPEQCNILCANTEENKKRIQSRLGKKFFIGSVPLEGEKPKMFTFCTRTVYLGADFYSLCARSFIFSDANSDCLAVDISEDLPQILGRQRLFENPWKNSATFFYRSTADYRKMSVKDFEEIIDNKRKATEDLLLSYRTSPTESSKITLARTYQQNIKAYNYKDNYIAINSVKNGSGTITLQPVVNNLVLVNEIRAFKIQQIDYKDRFTVFSTIHEHLTKDDVTNMEISKFIKIYDSKNTILEKLRLLCEYGLSSDSIRIFLSQIADSDEVKSYYLALGPQRLKALGYNVTRIKKELGIVTFSYELLLDSIYSEFKEGDKYILSGLKNKLSYIYSSINYKSTPKANDIEKWFNVKEISVYEKKEDGSRKRIKAYELLKSKEQELRFELKHAQ